MNTLMLIAALSCPAPELINKTDKPWNPTDSENLAYAKRRCKEVYPDAPCVKTFIKYNVQQYSVVCGPNK